MQTLVRVCLTNCVAPATFPGSSALVLRLPPSPLKKKTNKKKKHTHTLQPIQHYARSTYTRVQNLDNGTGAPVGNAERYAVLTRDGVRIGVMGLVEEDWITTLSHPPSGLLFTDFVQKGRELEHALRTTHKCDVIIALTHMRWPNNEKLAAEVSGIDLVLTGHDHFYKTSVINNTPIVISGSDFRYLSEIELTLADEPSHEKKAELSKCVKHTVTAAFPENETIKSMLSGLQAEIEKVSNIFLFVQKSI